MTLQERYPDSQIQKALAFAEKCHLGQQRLSGEPFISHPVAVAEIVADEGLSGPAVIAALLHDTIEDSDCQYEDIEKEFGSEIADMVAGLTKIAAVTPRKSSRQHRLASYRKLILAASDDARVLVIKLADRLHNMRTIQALPPARQQQFAKETIEIYAPLAHRLGMGKIKDELADRALAISDPQAYQEANKLRETRFESRRQDLHQEIERLLNEAKIEGEVQDRLKSRSSIAAKLARRPESDILDIIGIRVLLNNRDDCYRVLGLIHNHWPPIPDRFKDWIAVPRANLYQSLHTTVMASGKPVEVQIRTVDQHQIAEHGIAAHWLYKENLSEGGPIKTSQYIAQAAAGQSDALGLEEAFLQLKKDIFADEIYVFSPKGDVKILPIGSCSIDFAYQVHSGLGDSCVGARVDHALVPLTKELHSGQVVEIIVGERQGPARDWLAAVKTSKARLAIRRFHQKSLDQEQAELGRKRIREAASGAKLATIVSDEDLDQELKKAGLNPNQVFLEAARDKTRVRGVVRQIINSIAGSTQRKIKRKPTPKQTSGAAVAIDDMEGIDFHLAGCCSPEPGDPITGFVSLSRGVIIHHRHCRNLLAQKRQVPARVVGAQWRTGDAAYRSELDVSFLDRPGLLHDLASAVSSSGAELTELELKTSGQVARGRLVATVVSPEQSQKLREGLSGIEGSLTIARRTPSKTKKKLNKSELIQ